MTKDELKFVKEIYLNEGVCKHTNYDRIFTNCHGCPIGKIISGEPCLYSTAKNIAVELLRDYDPIFLMEKLL